MVPWRKGCLRQHQSFDQDESSFSRIAGGKFSVLLEEFKDGEQMVLSSIKMRK